MITIEASEDLAKALKVTCRPDLAARPWDFNRPRDCHWWLVPGAAWPAFSAGKVICSAASQSPRSRFRTLPPALHPDRFFVGLNIEKGYGKEALEVVPTLKQRPDHFLTDLWPWTEFVKAKGAARFRAALSAAAATTTDAVHLYVKASQAHERIKGREFPEDVLVFTFGKDGLSLLASNELGVDVLTHAQSATTFDGLVTSLGQVSGYFWLDVYVGIYVTAIVSPMQIYSSFLSHFSDWMVPGV